MHESSRTAGPTAIRPRFHSIDFADVSRGPPGARRSHAIWQVILKRLMLRAAEAVARERSAYAIVTGEAVGQVSSQTLANLHSISAATSLPILRPLIGMNKEEIVQTAHRIGTGPLSAVVDEYCALTRKNPATKTHLEVIEAQDREMDPAVLEHAIEAREVLNLAALDVEDAGLPELEATSIPPGAIVVDLRSPREYEQWHPKDAVHLDWNHALEAYRSFGKEQTYVLYCEYGLKSAHLAELMHAAGLRGLHFRGGTRALRKSLDG